MFGEKKNDLHKDFINLEKTYDKVSKVRIWWILRKKGVYYPKKEGVLNR